MIEILFQVSKCDINLSAEIIFTFYYLITQSQMIINDPVWGVNNFKTCSPLDCRRARPLVCERIPLLQLAAGVGLPWNVQ